MQSEGTWWDVAGASMWPLRPPMRVQLAPATIIEPGDIIGFIGSHPGTLVLHRVHAIDGDRVVARGDTNRVRDPAVPRTAIIGKLAAIRLGPVVVRLPDSRLTIMALRRLGLAWSQAAPPLRSAFARARQISRKIAPKS